MCFARNIVLVAILLAALPSEGEATSRRFISFTWTTYKKTGPDAAGRTYKINHLDCVPNEPCELQETWVTDDCDRDPGGRVMVNTNVWFEPSSLKVADDGQSLRVTVTYPSGEITTHRLQFEDRTGSPTLVKATGGYMYTSQDRVVQGELAVLVSGSHSSVDLPLNCRRIWLPAIPPSGSGSSAKTRK